MRAIFGTHWMVACALALGACAMDGTPVDNSPKGKATTVDNSTASASTPAEASADTPSDVTIPEELSFESLPDVTTSGEDGPERSCHVKILSCGKIFHSHPPHLGPPRYCTYGYCKHVDKKQAKSTCDHECAHAHCDKLEYEGRCDHDHDHAPDTSQI